MFKKIKNKVIKLINAIRDDLEFKAYERRMKHLDEQDKAMLGYISTIVESELRRQEMRRKDFQFNVAVNGWDFETEHSPEDIYIL